MRRLFEPTACHSGAKRVIAAVLAFGLAAAPARAEAPTDAPDAAPARPVPRFALRTHKKPETPGIETITMLVRTTLIAVNQGK